MSPRLFAFIIVAGFTFAPPAFTADAPAIEKVNGAIHLTQGQVASDLSTVNGSVALDAHARADAVETVNGSIDLGDDTDAASLETVNGGIALGQRAHVRGKVDTVNGAVTLAIGAEVLGGVSNVNGRIRLEAAHVAGGIQTVNGDIDVGAGSRVQGGILVEKPTGWSSSKPKPPRIVIGPEAEVQGRLVFKHVVRLFVSDRARIGEIEGATPVKFSGALPES